MSKAKFTKGEWLGFKDGKWQSDYVNDYTLDGDNNPSWVQVTCDGQAVAIVPNHGNTLDANAHLIAAAPEMYEMLDEVLNVLGHELNPTNKSYIKAIKELLAKARGEKC